MFWFRKGWVTLKTPYELEDCIKTTVQVLSHYTCPLFPTLIHSHSPWLPILSNMTFNSLVDSRSSNSFIDSAFIKPDTSQLMAYYLSAQINWWNIQFHHLAGPGTCNFVSLLGSPRNCHCLSLCGPELHDCTRILLAHPLQSLNCLGIGQHLFPAIGTTQILELTPHWDVSICSAPVETSRPCLRDHETTSQ